MSGYLARRLLLPFLLPFALAEGVLKFFGVEHSCLIGWETECLTHTLAASYGLMARELRFVKRQTLNRVRFWTLFVVAVVFVGKILLAGVELGYVEHLSRMASVVAPHWLIVPVLVFFAANATLYWMTKRATRRIGALHVQQDREMLGLIWQVDMPIVVGYVIVLIYGIWLVRGIDISDFFRGMACALLMVSNLSTIAYEYTNLGARDPS